MIKELQKKYVEERICIIESCGKIFYVPKRVNKTKTGIYGLRQIRSKTCSKECKRELDKIYQRNYRRKK